MDYTVSFGTLTPAARAPFGPAFRLALLGDFSGRASAGTLDAGAALAARKPLRVDVRLPLDDVLARLAPRIRIRLGDDEARHRGHAGQHGPIFPSRPAGRIAAPVQ